MTVGVEYKGRDYTVDYQEFGGEYLIDQIIDDEHPAVEVSFGVPEYYEFMQKFWFAIFEQGINLKGEVG
jgi:hypothetical protein